MLLNLFLIYSIIRKSPKADWPSEQFQTKRLSLVVAAAPEQDDRDDHQPATVILKQIVKATYSSKDVIDLIPSFSLICFIL